jgi:hypothetical protein
MNRRDFFYTGSCAAASALLPVSAVKHAEGAAVAQPLSNDAGAILYVAINGHDGNPGSR